MSRRISGIQIEDMDTFQFDINDMGLLDQHPSLNIDTIPTNDVIGDYGASAGAFTARPGPPAQAGAQGGTGRQLLKEAI